MPLARIMFVFFFSVSLIACQHVPSDEEIACANVGASKDDNLDKLAIALQHKDQGTAQSLKADGYSDDYIRKYMLTTLYRSTARCDGILNRHQKNEEANSVEYLRNRIRDKYLPAERAEFQKRSGGKLFCNTDLGAFVSTTYQPEKICVYPYSGDYIKSFQSTGDGLLAVSSFMGTSLAPNNPPIFIYSNPIDSSVADNQILERGLFEYAGVYRYSGLFGTKSVYSFRRIDKDMMEDLWFYKGE